MPLVPLEDEQPHRALLRYEAGLSECSRDLRRLCQRRGGSAHDYGVDHVLVRNARRVRVLEYNDCLTSSDALEVKDLLDTGRKRRSRGHAEKRNRRTIERWWTHILTRPDSPNFDVDLLTNRDGECSGWLTVDLKWATTTSAAGPHEERRYEPEQRRLRQQNKVTAAKRARRSSWEYDVHRASSIMNRSSRRSNDDSELYYAEPIGMRLVTAAARRTRDR